MQIFDKHGQLLATSMPDHSRSFYQNDLRHADLRNQEIEGISFDGSDLRGADFSNADLYWAFFGDADCRECIFFGADLSGAIFQDANLQGADFRKAKLTNDNLGGPTDLRGANLTNILADDTDFTGATYDDLTVFPIGFDPAKRGLVFRDSNS
jgi:uncharacterized protein YjbI with pentapeptide repeats